MTPEKRTAMLSLLRLIIASLLLLLGFITAPIWLAAIGS